MTSRHQHRNKQSAKKIGLGNSTNVKVVTPKNIEEYFSLTGRARDRWDRVTHAISKMRKERVSLQRASREFGLSPKTVIRLGGAVLKKRRNGHYSTRAKDRRLRVLLIPTLQALREVGIKDSLQASLVGRYWDAIHKYLLTGDASGLWEFRGQHITDTNGRLIPLLTDLHALDRLGCAGVLSFESVYARAA